MKSKKQNNKYKEEDLSIFGWFFFKEFKPELNQKVEIYWSTDEITKQIWKDDIVYTSNEIPRFWRTCI